jgi:hypothetical protein
MNWGAFAALKGSGIASPAQAAKVYGRRGPKRCVTCGALKVRNPKTGRLRCPVVQSLGGHR